MTSIDLDTLEHVTGGATVGKAAGSSDATLTQSLADIQSSISSLASNKGNNQNNLLLPMAMMIAMNRRQPTVVLT